MGETIHLLLALMNRSKKGKEEPVRKVEATWNVGEAKRTLGTGTTNVSSKLLLLPRCRLTLSLQTFGEICCKHKWLDWIWVYVYVCRCVCV